jgi:hypothetical protein
MQKWEHLVLHTGVVGGKQTLTWINDKQMLKQGIEFYPYLNKLGDEGWEVVASDGDIRSYGYFVLKRPKE